MVNRGMDDPNYPGGYPTALCLESTTSFAIWRSLTELGHAHTSYDQDLSRGMVIR